MDQITTITRKENARLIRIRKIRDGKIRTEVYIEGLRSAEELLRSEVSISEGVITPEVVQDARGSALVDRLLQLQVPLFQVSRPLFQSIADTVHPQGIVLIAERPETGKHVIEKSLDIADTNLLVVLYQVGDPSNVGAIFRTAEAAGVSGLITSEGSANCFSPKAIRAALGANLRVPIWEGASIEEAIELARKRELLIAAADISGSRSYTELDWRKPSMVVFGSEAHGLPSKVLSRVDDVFVIPMWNGVESLNLAVSCGVVLFEALRQRSLPVGE